jgi:hypothetical protein
MVFIRGSESSSVAQHKWWSPRQPPINSCHLINFDQTTAGLLADTWESQGDERYTDSRRTTNIEAPLESPMSCYDRPLAVELVHQALLVAGQVLPKTAEPVPSGLRAGLATRLRDFVTNRHDAG